MLISVSTCDYSFHCCDIVAQVSCFKVEPMSESIIAAMSCDGYPPTSLMQPTGQPRLTSTMGLSALPLTFNLTPMTGISVRNGLEIISAALVLETDGSCAGDTIDAVPLPLATIAPSLTAHQLSAMMPVPRKPPSTATISPVMKLERVPSSRNSITLAISSGLA